MDTLHVLVMAPMLGGDVSYVSAVDPRITVSDGNHLVRRPREAVLGAGVSAGTGSADNAEDADRLLATADVLIVGFPIPTTVAARAPHLRWVHHVNAGVSNFHRSDLWTSDVRLTTARGSVATTAIAEYVLAGALYFARGLHDAQQRRSSGVLSRRGISMHTLAGRTMGVVGLGGIGREVARLGRAVGMRVVATRRSVHEPQLDVEGVDVLLPADHLHELAAASDVLAVCSQLTSETERMINAEVFMAMPSHAVLINVARGEEVDEGALVAALTTGEIRGAVLDVHDGDMLGHPPRPELARLPNVVLTPHNSGQGGDTTDEGRRLVAENLRRFLADEPLVNEVDRVRGY